MTTGKSDIVDISRLITYTMKFKTDFGSMYVHLDINAEGILLGGRISHPGKNPEAQITNLIEQIGEALNDCAASVGQNLTHSKKEDQDAQIPPRR